jgi:hypothetical protein
MATAASPTNREKRREDGKKKKLTKVLSTKLLIDDYNRFDKFTSFAYSGGFIDEPNISKFLRYIVTVPFKELQEPTFITDIGTDTTEPGPTTVLSYSS